MSSIYQVNDTDYDGEIVVEFFGYANSDEPFWHVPAWEERGFPELSGPFVDRAEAQAALSEFLGEDTYFVRAA
jgi:hypothetical protein